MTRKKFGFLLALALVASEARGEGRHDTDVLVALGAGVAGTWDTEFDLATFEDGPLSAFAGEQPHPFVCITSPCGIAYAPLPGNGTAKIVTSPADFGRFTGLLFVGADDAEMLPAVKARVVNRARPTQATDLPLYRRSTLVSRNPLVLAFPSAFRAAEAHSNLFLTEVGLTNPADLLVEAFASSGERLQLQLLSLAPGQTRILMDVLGSLGVPEAREAMIRVTKIGGQGVMWGLLSTVYADGRVTVTVGNHP